MLSVPHLIILFVVVLVVFGPHKLPELARSLGKLMAEFRKASTDFRYAFEEEMRNIERQARDNEIKKAQAAAAEAASATPALPATLATPPDSTTATDETITVEPLIRPNAEAVPRSEPEPETYAAEAPVDEPNASPDSSLDAEPSEKHLHGSQ